MSVELRVILNERVNHALVGLENGNHVRADDDLTIQNVVVGIVAAIHHKGKVDHKACGVTVAVGACIGVVWGQTVIGQKLRLALSIDNDTAACAFNVGSEINPFADEIKIVV